MFASAWNICIDWVKKLKQRRGNFERCEKMGFILATLMKKFRLLHELNVSGYDIICAMFFL